MGLRRDRVRRGLIVGGAVIGAIVAAIAVGAALPFTRDLFRDDKIIQSSVWWVLFQALVRVPLATALYEEVLFRGIVFGMLIRRTKPLVAGIVTSLLFGLWHILPTLDTINTNPAGDAVDSPLTFAIAIVFAVVGTAAGGVAFLLVRLYANSTFAAVLAHIGTNSVAMLGALVVINWL
jgi:membrane protease YdiL (CAAX protease family)